MIRFIAAIDNKRGIATDKGIPWDLPTDKKYYLDHIRDKLILVGAGTYHDGRPTKKAIVATNQVLPLLPEEIQTTDAAEYLRNNHEDIWVIGGAQIFASTIHQADELYLTLIEADFNCTKFFPEYENDFACVDPGTPQTENGITFRFTIWKRKQ